MARRISVRVAIAPLLSLALAVSISIAPLAALSPAAADQATSGQVSQPAAQGGEASPEAPARGSDATRKAERLARRAEREAAEAQETTTTNDQTSPSAIGGTTGAGSKATRQAKSGTVTVDSTPAASKSKGPSEREREEKRRAHEEQREKSGRESYKEKQARLAREAREAEEAPQSDELQFTGQTGGRQPTATASLSGLAPAASPEAKAATAEIAPEIAGEHGVESTKSTRAARHGAGKRRGQGGGSGSSSSTTTANSSATVGGASSGQSLGRSGVRHSGEGSTHRRRVSSSGGSPIVTTVTRIIGVVPTLLWLLIGALGLAALVFASSSRVAARRARRLDAQRRALLEDVGLLQAALLPELPDRLGAVTTTAAYRPASGPGAGGDFYDVFALPDGLVAAIVGDVSGHGRDALPHTTLLRYTLRTYLEAGLEPREALRSAAPALERQLGGSFATVVLATFDPRERLLRYACAGHPHPLLTGMASELTNLAASAPPIGTGRRTGTRQTTVEVPGAALVAFYTDGVIEARAEDGELFGEGRLAVVLDDLCSIDGDLTPSAALLLDRVRERTDRCPDDMAACLLGIAGDARPPRVVSEEIELDGRETDRERVKRFLLAAGVPEGEIPKVLDSARAIAADHGSALLKIQPDGGGHGPRLTLVHDNVAPLRARAIARTQEVAL